MSRQRDVVLQRIRELIVTGALKPNKIFSEAELAERFGTSRTPVRQAIAILDHEGLVDQRPQIGASVHQVSAEELDQLIELRIVVESLTAAALAETTSPDRLEGLEELLDRMETCINKGDKVGFNDVDAEFHCRIAANSGRLLAEEIVRSMRDKIRILGLNALREDGAMKVVLAEHYDIFEAISNRQAEDARSAVDTHLTQAAKRIRATDPERFGAADLSDLLVN